MSTESAPSANGGDLTGRPTNEEVWQALSTIPDPEFGINIVDMGLIYSVESKDGIVDVVMTLTTPTCPSGGWIQQGVNNAIEQLPGMKEYNVVMTFEPPWESSMLSAEGRRQLGWPEEGEP